MNILLKYFKGDKVIWVIIILLSLISILAVYSSTFTLAHDKANDTSYLLKHSFILIFGFVLMYWIHGIDYKYFTLFSRLALIISIPLLVLTFFMGSSINDATRWLIVPVINLSFQTSDFAKIALVMYLAYMLTKRNTTIKDFKKGFLPLIIPTLIICGLIFPTNFSTAALTFGTSVVIMYIGQTQLKHILLTILACLVFAILFIIIAPEGTRAGTWKSRIVNFSKGEEGDNYQSDHSKMAIASGMIIGKGPGESSIKNFLPQAYSDFIFAIIIEEYGTIIGGFFVVMLYLILIYRIVSIAKNCEKEYPMYLSIGLGLLIIFQAFSNMAVAVNIIPVTGQPLPLISMGGTSIWFSSIALGMILSVSRSVNEKEKVEINE